MGRHELRYEGLERIADRDAYGVRLGWWRDSRRLGVVLGARDRDCRGRDHAKAEPAQPDARDRLWRAVAACTVESLRVDVLEGRGRTEWTIAAHYVEPDPAEVKEPPRRR